MKVCVYAIARNEEQFVDRWMASMQEADCVCVLDTGSADRTAEKLADRGAVVRQEDVSPWRFDAARNRSMKLVPPDTDICVCTDLDEVFRLGWRKLLENAWEPGTEQLRYTSIWSFGPRGTPGTTFLQEKIHAPGVFRWHHPVHEVLRRTDGQRTWKTAVCPEIVLEHHPDPKKSRAEYLPLLELSVRENPEDDRNAHYLGREYMFHGMYAEAIPVLKRHLEMPGAVWQPERCASMRFLSRCYLSMGDRRQGMVWALRAIAEAPELREPWVQAQEAAYAAEDWEGVVYYGRRAVDITERSGFYINEDRAWGAYPWDAMAYACYRIGDLRAAREYGEQALLEEPDNPRLLKNMRFYTGDPAGTQRSGSCGERTGAQAHGVGAEVPLGRNGALRDLPDAK